LGGLFFVAEAQRGRREERSTMSDQKTYTALSIRNESGEISVGFRSDMQMEVLAEYAEVSETIPLDVDTARAICNWFAHLIREDGGEQ